MFASMFNSLFKKTKVNKKTEPVENVVAARQDVEKLLLEFNQPKVNTHNEDCQPISKAYSAFELLSLDDNLSTIGNDEGSDNASETTDDSKSELSSEKKSEPTLSSEDQSKSKMVNKLNNLQCPFTWSLRGKNKYNIGEYIKNKYGDFNLDISQPKFTFERFIGNLIISYELFHNEDKEIAQLKVLEIGKWLEELDNGSDEFYLSINIGLKHVTMSTFAHMVFATNLIEQSQWLLDDIVHFPSLTSKPRAAVHAARAAVLIEYGGYSGYFKKANECAKKACDLDPTSSYWFYLYSVVMTAQRQFLLSYKSCPTEKEKNAVQTAIMLSDGNNTKYNFHRMVLDRETIANEFHADKNNRDKMKMEKNIKDNKTIVQMIKTILNMDPEDPHIVVKCARTLITLPYMVRDIELGKEYLSRALQMAPNDMTVIKAVTNTIELSKDIIKKNNFEKNHHTAKVNQLGEDLRYIVEKHKKKENAVPYLTDLVAKYDNNEKWKIVSQICSYSVLFNNNLRAGIEQFMMLIEQPNLANSKIITSHYSSFINGCNKFNLAELVVNEISLAIVSSNTLSTDLVYYVNVLSKILEKCQLNRKDADPLMCSNIKSNVSTLSACSNITYQKESNLMDNESVDLDSESIQNKRTRTRKTKHLPNTKVFNKSEGGKKSNQNASSKSNQNANSKKNTPKSTKNVQNNTQQKKANDAAEQMKYKVEKFLSSTPTPVFSNIRANDPTSVNLSNLQTQSDIEKYARQLYQNIVNRSNQEPPNANPNLYQHFNDNNPGPSFSQQPQNMYFNSNVRQGLPNLATMRQQNPPPGWKPPKPYFEKKK